MMRIAHIIQSVGDRSGGTSTAFLQLMAAMATQADLAPVAYTLRPEATDAANIEIAAHPDAWRLAGSLGRLGAGELGALVARDLRDGRIDLLHLHGVWSPDLLCAARAARSAGVAYCWQPHGMLLDHALAQKPLKKRLFMAMGMARAIRHADAMIYCTAGERDHTILPRGSDARRGRIVYLPVSIPHREADIPALRAAGRVRLGVPADAPLVAFMGRVHPVKRLELTLRAFRAAAPSLSPAARLAILGSGDEPYLAALGALAASLGIADRIMFAGWISGDDRWRVLAAADALVLNSLHENFGYTVPEALGVHTPVVMTGNLALAADVGAASAASLDGAFARIVEPTPERLGAAMAEVLTNPPSISARAHGRRWVLGAFSPEAIGGQLRALYGELLPARLARAAASAAT